MQPREKRLAIVAGVCLAMAAGYGFFRGAVTGRLDRLRDQQTLLEESVLKLENDESEIITAQGKIFDWQSRSFPPDDVAAQRMYLAWLTDLVHSAGFTSPKLSPSRGTPNKVYSAFRVKIEADATFSQLCTFLFQFRRTNLLHRIAELTVEGDAGSATSPLNVVIVAEGLSLRNAAPRAFLFPKTELLAAIEPSSDKLSVAKPEGFPTKGEFLIRSGGELMKVQEVDETTWSVLRGVDGTTAVAHKQGDAVELFPLLPNWKDRKIEDFRALTSQNPFAKPEKPKPPETPKKEEPKPVVKLDDPAAKTTKFVGATVLNDEHQICFLDPANDKRTYVKVGEGFSVAGIKGTLVEVHSGYILVQIEQDKWRLELGKELAAMKKLDAAGNPIATPSSPPAGAEKSADSSKPSGEQPKSETASAETKAEGDQSGKAGSDEKQAEAEAGEGSAPSEEKPAVEAAAESDSSASAPSAGDAPVAAPSDSK